jgi:hypothetical protein
MLSLFGTEQKPPHASRWRALLGILAKWIARLSEPAPYQVSRWVFLRLLGLIYLCAFASLWVQLDGLIGSNGILPAERLMELAATQLGGRIRLFPTLLWLGASDGFLHALTATGVALASLLVAGIAPATVLLTLWILYLSLSLGGQVFFSFQWDTLLLETGFLAVWLAPLTLWPAAERRAPVQRPALWLLWWLLFRLMFESGAVKLTSHDPSWASFAALRFHYETQPLPTWIGWYAHQMPWAIHWLGTAGLFGIELGAPVLIFTRRRLRRAACVALITLQVVIAATGNYCFFNALTVALCLLLLDDAIWPTRLRCLLLGSETQASKGMSRNWPLAVLLPASVTLFVLSLAPTAASLGLGTSWLGPVPTLYGWVQPFRTINSYGLFAVMTTERPEIIIEGSLDGERWEPYEFKYKPGDLSRSPAFVAPHQPRLDWQMWFAALGPVEENPWFLHFLQRLLAGSSDVAALLEINPFPEKPPTAVRAVAYDYWFTDSPSREATGNWWRRESRREYCPAVTLNNEGRLILFRAVSGLEAGDSRTTP